MISRLNFKAKKEIFFNIEKYQKLFCHKFSPRTNRKMFPHICLLLNVENKAAHTIFFKASKKNFFTTSQKIW